MKPLKDKNLLSRVQDIIVAVEQADKLQDISHCKKMQGSDNYYRIKVGDYRLGLSSEDDTITFVRFLSRGDIYQHFP